MKKIIFGALIVVIFLFLPPVFGSDYAEGFCFWSQFSIPVLFISSLVMLIPEKWTYKGDDRRRNSRVTEESKSTYKYALALIAVCALIKGFLL